MADVPDILQRIIAKKIQEVETGKASISSSVMQQRAVFCEERPRGFVDCILTESKQGRPAVIAELKKASPTRGFIRENFVASEIAQDFAAAGAACLSVLTDRQFFHGRNEYLVQARTECTLPVLRKDFIVDTYQVFETRAIGADCILLIAAILDAKSLKSLSDLAGELGLDVLIEVHNPDELEMALALNPRLIGINNRNLHTFTVSLNTTIDLMDSIPEEIPVISESGIAKRDDVNRLTDAGVKGFLVGESLMADENPGKRLKQLFFEEDIA